MRAVSEGADVSLRTKVLRGGAFLACRQAIGIALGLAGVVLVTRVIGPGQYGLYAVAIGIVSFLCALGTWGLDVYLLRGTEQPDEREFHQAFTLLLCISAVFLVGLGILSPFIASFVKIQGVARLVVFLAASIPLNLLAVPAIVKLDRDLNFKQVAINELAGQASTYAVAIPLAFAGSGAWAPASGFLTQQLVLMALSYRSAAYRPSLHWDTALILKMLKYGLAYSSSIWVWQLRGLVNPFIVGRFAGAEAVGYVAVSIRFAEVLSFAKTATWRIAMATFAKISDDRGRLRNSITEGMRLQAMAVGFPLAVFALVGPFLILLGLGHNWTPALAVFPFIALSYLSNAMFNLHCSVLYLLGENSQVRVFCAAHMVLFAGSAALLVPHLGIRGYGWAEMIALLSYVVIHTYLVRQIESPSYGVAGIWFATTVCVLALSSIGPPTLYGGFVVLLLPLCFPKERASLMGYAQILFPRFCT
jgi:O-antigen/teichoic acid export membrane protein